MPAIPILIVTRPMTEGRAFAERVTRALDDRVEVVLSPAFTIVDRDVQLPARCDGLVFTSARGVAQAVRLGAPKLRAWCVGDRTADAAQVAGFDVVSAHGDADALVTLITQSKPRGQLVHVTSEQRRGDVAERLGQAGIACVTVAAYAQQALPPSETAVRVAAGNRPVVAPCFSPRSAAPLLVLDWQAPLHLVAISRTVAQALEGLHPDTMTVATRPEGNAMLEETLMVLRRLLDQ